MIEILPKLPVVSLKESASSAPSQAAVEDVALLGIETLPTRPVIIVDPASITAEYGLSAYTN